jgi:hypothetical protein
MPVTESTTSSSSSSTRKHKSKPAY